MNAHQLTRFIAATDGLNLRRSLAATDDILLGAEYHFDLVRPGIGLISIDLIAADVRGLEADPDCLELCPSQSIDELAARAYTIWYGILTNISPRYKRCYECA